MSTTKTLISWGASQKGHVIAVILSTRTALCDNFERRYMEKKIGNVHKIVHSRKSESRKQLNFRCRFWEKYNCNHYVIVCGIRYRSPAFRTHPILHVSSKLLKCCKTEKQCFRDKKVEKMAKTSIHFQNIYEGNIYSKFMVTGSKYSQQPYNFSTYFGL